jgi:RNA polymerase sigma-70 factor, ECF subfamily
MKPIEENKKEEIELVENIRSGDKKSFEKLFYSFYSKLHRFADNYLHDSAAADDIVQDLFVNIWFDRKKFVINYSLSSYLYKSVRNRVLNHLNKEHNVSILAESDLQILPDMHNIEDEMVQSELKNQVNSAIEALPPRCKLIFNLHRKDNLKYSEIAQILDISENTVTTQIGRALKKLRSDLGKYYEN